MEGLVMNPAFWSSKRVFLTGHTGFKGSWMSLWLQSLGADLTGYSLEPPTKPSLFEIANVVEGMHSIIADIRNLEFLKTTMRETKPEIVIHMAAQPLVRHSYEQPVETYAINVMGTVHLLEAVRHTPSVKSVVIITTDKCYENREWDWGYRESDPMGGYDIYSNSKGCAELVTSAYRSSFFNPKSHDKHGVGIASARAGNVIGGGDWAKDRLIPDILAAFEAGRPVSIRNPKAIRPWQHVLEPLRGYLTLAEKLCYEGAVFSGGWNFGPNDEDTRPVEWIVQEMAHLWGEGAAWQVDQGYHPHETAFLKLDISKARSRLNWHPVLRLTDALTITVDWAKQRHAGKDMKTMTLSQIKTYQSLTTR